MGGSLLSGEMFHCQVGPTQSRLKWHSRVSRRERAAAATLTNELGGVRVSMKLSGNARLLGRVRGPGDAAYG